MRRVGLILALGLLLIAQFGCAIAGPIRGGHEPGHAVILPGCNSSRPGIFRFCKQIDEEASGVSAQVWDWTAIEPTTMLVNLKDLDRNHRRSQILADALVAWRRENPNTKLYLIGFSGGAGIAFFTIERLPEDFEIERVVLIGGSVSPDYDLTPVLRRSKYGIFSTYSAADKYWCRDFMRRYGTMERKHEPGAGYLGFNLPEDPALAAKVEQFAWTPSLRALGHHGGHWGAMAPAFASEYLVPLFAVDPARSVAIEPAARAADDTESLSSIGSR